MELDFDDREFDLRLEFTADQQRDGQAALAAYVAARREGVRFVDDEEGTGFVSDHKTAAMSARRQVGEAVWAVFQTAYGVEMNRRSLARAQAGSRRARGRSAPVERSLPPFGSGNKRSRRGPTTSG